MMALLSVQNLLLAGLLASTSVQTIAATPPLAIDVQLTPKGLTVVEKSRDAFDPDGPPGWKMTDRFRGFRFELSLATTASVSARSFMDITASIAREARCFGWIQAPTQAPNSVVGEVRCPKQSALALETHLRTSGTLQLATYANSKIRYHFPRFRVLTEPRYEGKTCFSTPPHPCTYPPPLVHPPPPLE